MNGSKSIFVSSKQWCPGKYIIICSERNKERDRERGREGERKRKKKRERIEGNKGKKKK